VNTRDKKLTSLSTAPRAAGVAIPAPAPKPAPECDEAHDNDRDCRPRKPGRPRRLVERTWYFDYDDDRDCDDRRDCDGRRRDCEDPCKPGGRGGSCPGRPTRPPGSDTGRLGPGAGMTPGDINTPNPPGVFVGPRAQLDLPYLFMRANPADLGARPIVNAPFWESPDIFLLAGVDPALAPPKPPALGQIALAGQPNTIYAHVWNFGNAAANEVIVEFYWVNPALGISSASVNLIAQTFTALGAKGSGQSHRVVKCPVAWVPTYVNGGHECLLVRVWDNPSDLPGQPTFDASWNRHIGQRNIHVNTSAQNAGAMSVLRAGAPALQQPILIKVGPLFGAPATVAVQRVAPTTIPWLQLHTGQRGVFPAMATPTGVATLSPPTATAGGFPTGGGAADQQVRGDDQHVAFTTTDVAPGPGEAHSYRVSATQGSTVFGGYTIVLLGPPR
jgi:hypothetical protein